MTWTAEVADLLSTSLQHNNLCDAGHGEHGMGLKDVVLDGPTGVPDYPSFDGDFRRSFSIAIYDWRQYDGIPMYCPGNDAVSQAIDLQGVWEGFETLLALDILRRSDSDPLFVDLGSQVGWYSLLLGSSGSRVLSVDADPENLRLLEYGARENGLRLGTDIVTTHAWLGQETPVVPPGDHVRLLKADVEGMEIEVARIWGDVFSARDIDYAFMEVTPQFSDRYPEILRDIVADGYSLHIIPDKGDSVEAFAADPLGVTLGRHMELSDVRSLTKQVNVLLAKT